MDKGFISYQELGHPLMLVYAVDEQKEKKRKKKEMGVKVYPDKR
jgi:hypothetical protein